VNCTCCGNIPDDEKYMYCDFCKTFGHSCATCEAE
jgi:hypothetical protein